MPGMEHKRGVEDSTDISVLAYSKSVGSDNPSQGLVSRLAGKEVEVEL